MREYHTPVIEKLDAIGLLDVLNKTQCDHVIVLSESEWEVPGVTMEVAQRYKDNNVKLTIVLGSYDTPNDYVDNVYWPTYWFNWSRQNLKHANPPTFDISNVKYPFISLNNRSHYHRCVFIDEMARMNLLDKGVVTWVKHLNENNNYPYQYFDNRQLLLNDDFKTKLDSFLFPIEYNESLFHIVTEATHKSIFITEKTVIPTLLKKPYLVLGAMGFNSKLSELGFKLYDELFDYSFDSEPDIFKRTTMFVENVKKITMFNLLEVYNMILPKITYNYNRALEIIKDQSLIPDIVKQCILETDSNHTVYGRYTIFMNEALND